jgi:hypothetical protein
MHEFTIRLQADNDIVTVHIFATSFAKATEMVLNAENAPTSAILDITCKETRYAA